MLALTSASQCLRFCRQDEGAREPAASETLQFDGTVRMKATISEAAGGGVKSVLLKAIDPLFKRGNAGAVIPIKIHGSRNDPKIGLDFGRTLKRQ